MSSLWPFQTDGGLHLSPSLLDKTGQQWFVHQPLFDTIIQAVVLNSDQLVVSKAPTATQFRIHEVGEHQLLTSELAWLKDL